MPCCCTKNLKLCAITVCSGYIMTIEGAPATSSGTYVLALDFLGNKVVIEGVQVEGEDVRFPLGGLNEHYTYTGSILDDEGVPFTIPDPESTLDDPLPDYDCIEFETVMAQVIPAPEI